MIDIATNLVRALKYVKPTHANPLIGWAWVDAEYRRSADRAFHGEGGALTIADAVISALEAAMADALRDQRVRGRWKDEDLWTTVLSLLGAASSRKSVDIPYAVKKILDPPPVRVTAALANVVWNSDPTQIGDLAIGRVRSSEDIARFLDVLPADAGVTDELHTYAVARLREYNDYVIATSTSIRQDTLAFQDFERKLDDLVGLTLLLAETLDKHNVISLRGATNRPGIRGITIDRSALTGLLPKAAVAELGARVLEESGSGHHTSVRWQSADPMPLDQVLDPELRSALGDLLIAQDAIAQRLRIAGRWHARAFWADASDDAALAVSVALDSLLTGKDAVPGAVAKGRFALLEQDPHRRASQFKRYEDVYQVRSAIAHGGDAERRLAQIGGARSIMEDSHWVAHQLLALRRLAKPATDRDFRELWGAIQWGTIEWTN